MPKSKILIVDDAELNRDMLTVMLGDQYDFLYACDGMEAVDKLAGEDSIDLMLLDLNMPQMNGFDVLRVMNERHWIDEIPVIIISAEDGSEFITRAYQMGVKDYISRPFQAVVVQRRVENTLLVYSNQKRLIHLVESQVYEREKTNTSMINILSNVIETRNHELGSHTLNVQIITNMLLRELVKKTDRYQLSKSDISLISTLAALHDIGKIKVPDAIINKPGKLDPDEWAVMQSHTVEGDLLLSGSDLDQNSKFVRTARAICRWHHEKYDGGGYPDGLKGDDIPIAAQVVSMADVYDALTSDRCYKRAFSHERALEMILNGECGQFNPLLIECLKDVAGSLKHILETGERYDFQEDATEVADEILATNGLPQEVVLRRMLDNERRKKDFFMECADGIQFEYDKLLQRSEFVYTNLEGVLKHKKVHAAREAAGNLLPPRYWDALREKLLETTRDDAVVTMNVQLNFKDGEHPYKARMMALWSEQNDEAEYDCVVGHFTPQE
jgi:response regulator RpfG family c-di-GMP phosphodiesterase